MEKNMNFYRPLIRRIPSTRKMWRAQYSMNDDAYGIK